MGMYAYQWKGLNGGTHVILQKQKDELLILAFYRTLLFSHKATFICIFPAKFYLYVVNLTFKNETPGRLFCNITNSAVVLGTVLKSADVNANVIKLNIRVNLHNSFFLSQDREGNYCFAHFCTSFTQKH